MLMFSMDICMVLNINKNKICFYIRVFKNALIEKPKSCLFHHIKDITFIIIIKSTNYANEIVIIYKFNVWKKS